MRKATQQQYRHLSVVTESVIGTYLVRSYSTPLAPPAQALPSRVRMGSHSKPTGVIHVQDDFMEDSMLNHIFAEFAHIRRPRTVYVGLFSATQARQVEARRSRATTTPNGRDVWRSLGRHDSNNADVVFDQASGSWARSATLRCLTPSPRQHALLRRPHLVQDDQLGRPTEVRLGGITIRRTTWVHHDLPSARHRKRAPAQAASLFLLLARLGAWTLGSTFSLWPYGGKYGYPGPGASAPNHTRRNPECRDSRSAPIDGSSARGKTSSIWLVEVCVFVRLLIRDGRVRRHFALRCGSTSVSIICQFSCVTNARLRSTARTVTRGVANGVGNSIAIEVTGNPQGGNIGVTYVNQDGVQKQTSTTEPMGQAIRGRALAPCALAVGDTGARASSQSSAIACRTCPAGWRRSSSHANSRTCFRPGHRKATPRTRRMHSTTEWR